MVKMKQIKLLTMFAMFLVVLTSAFAGSWSSYVLDSSGAPISGASVLAVNPTTLASLGISTTTNASGYFTIAGITSSVRLNTSMSSYNTDTTQILPPITTQNFTLPFNITLNDALRGALNGTVTNGTAPLLTATIRLMQGSTQVAITTSGVGGRYSFTNVIDGTYTVEASNSGYVTQQITNVLIQPNLTTSNVDFALLQGLGISSGPTVSGISSSSATVSWTTTIASNTSVNYGTTPGLGTIRNTNNAVTSHSQALTGLSASTTYFYAVTSCSGATCVTSLTQSFTTSAASSGGSGGGGGSGSTTRSTIDSPLISGQLISNLNIKWDITKNPFTKTIRPIDTIVFTYDGTSYNLFVDKFDSKTGVIGFRVSPTDEAGSGYKNDEFRFNIKDKLLIVTPQNITYDEKVESRSAIKLRLYLMDKPKQENIITTVVQKVKNGIIKIAGEITPPKVSSVPVGIGISVATVLIGLLLFLGIKRVFV